MLSINHIIKFLSNNQENINNSYYKNIKNFEGDNNNISNYII